MLFENFAGKYNVIQPETLGKSIASARLSKKVVS